MSERRMKHRVVKEKRWRKDEETVRNEDLYSIRKWWVD